MTIHVAVATIRGEAKSGTGIFLRTGGKGGDRNNFILTGEHYIQETLYETTPLLQKVTSMTRMSMCWRLMNKYNKRKNCGDN